MQGNTTTASYNYDLAGRLQTVIHNGVATTYAYDENGNRLSKQQGTNIETGVYDDQDRLQRYADCTYAYSDNGELNTKTCADKTTRYHYDVLGNLMNVTLPDNMQIEYEIDGQNRRIGKRINGELQQGFLYQDQLNPVAELDGNNNIVARFVYADKINVPAYIIKEGVMYRILSDHLGSVRLVVNANTAEVMQRIDYDEFGKIISDSNPGFQPFRFAGGLYDKDTKLTRFGARDYDANIGRWTSKDPIFFDGRDTNLYGYAFGDPINFIDPDGRLINIATGIIGAAVGAAFAAATGQSVTVGAISGGLAGAFPGGGALVNALIGAGAGVIGSITDPCTRNARDIITNAAAGAFGGVAGRQVGIGLGVSAARGGFSNASLGVAFRGQAAGGAVAAGSASGASSTF